MKKLVLSLTLVAFAFALQAGETKSNKDKTTGTTKASATARTESTDAKKDCAACSSCCKPEPKKQTLLSPKDAAEKRT
jgi:hypothetical protein